jgi:hypothetical protein
MIKKVLTDPTRLGQRHIGVSPELESLEIVEAELGGAMLPRTFCPPEELLETCWKKGEDRDRFVDQSGSFKACHAG